MKKPMMFISPEVPLYSTSSDDSRFGYFVIIITENGIYAGVAVQNPYEESDPEAATSIAMDRAIKAARGEI